MEIAPISTVKIDRWKNAAVAVQGARGPRIVAFSHERDSVAERTEK
jgi:hypothetical protein